MTPADFERLQWRFTRHHHAPHKILNARDYVHRLFELHRMGRAG